MLISTTFGPALPAVGGGHRAVVTNLEKNTLGSGAVLFPPIAPHDGGGGGLNLVWEIWRCNLAAKFPRPNPGASCFVLPSPCALHAPCLIPCPLLPPNLPTAKFTTGKLTRHQIPPPPPPPLYHPNTWRFWWSGSVARPSDKFPGSNPRHGTARSTGARSNAGGPNTARKLTQTSWVQAPRFDMVGNTPRGALACRGVVLRHRTHARNTIQPPSVPLQAPSDSGRLLGSTSGIRPWSRVQIP